MTDSRYEDRIKDLTDKQVECLRLVGEFKTSKEIAIVIGVTHHTVDKRIKRAVATLCVANRQEAAKLIRDYENGAPLPQTETYQRTVYQQPDLTVPSSPWKEGAPFGGKSQPLGGEESELSQEQHLIIAQQQVQIVQTSPFKALFEVNRTNRLTIGARLAMMILIAIGGLGAVAVLVIMAEGLSRMVNKLPV